MTGFLRTGTDLDSILDPLGLNATSANTGFTIQGADIGQIYSPAGSGSPATNTNFLSNGTDIGPLFASRGSVNTTPANNYFYMWGINTTSPQAGIAVVHSWKQVALGRSSAGAVRSDGRLFMWGAGTSGELGQGNTTQQLSPIAVGASSWTMVTVGSFTGDPRYTLAIRSDGALFSWGANGSGQLGLGDLTGRSSPVQVGASSWSMVSTSEGNVNALTATGQLFSWGYNIAGALGLGDTVTRSSPVQVGASSWTSVSAGGNGSYLNAGAIRSDGALFMWGSNISGTLGQGNTTNRSSPVNVGTDSWTLISLGLVGGVASGHILAIRNDGALFAWGNNGLGQLGDGTQVNKSSPVQIGSSSWQAVSAGLSYSLGVKTDNTMWAWGSNAGGKLGDGSGLDQSSPVQIGNSYYNVTAWADVYASDFSFSMFKAGTVKNDPGFLYYCGGQFTGGLWQVSNSSGGPYPAPWPYWDPGNAPAFVNTTTGLYRSKPTLTLTRENSWKSIGSLAPGATASSATILAIRSDGLMFTWGPNTFGQCGVGDTVPRSSPVQVGASSWNMVSGGNQYACAIRSDNTLWAWGDGSNGKLGNNSIAQQNSPVQVGSSSWSMVKAGGTHTGAIRADGTLWCWGLGSSGQLGQNNTTTRSSPVQVGTRIWSDIQTGVNYTLGIQAGRLYAWGINAVGQLGDGTTTNRSSPVLIGNGVWRKVAAGLSHALAIDVNYNLWAWGGNNVGQLGDGTAIGKSSPVQIGTESYRVITAGNDTSGGIRTDGSLYMWGLGTNYAIGDAAASNRNSPVLVGNQGSPWTYVATGVNTTFALSATYFEPL